MLLCPRIVRLTSVSRSGHGQSPRHPRHPSSALLRLQQKVVMCQILYSNAIATASALWRLMGSAPTVACKRIADARSPQEIRPLSALSHSSRLAHMAVVFSVSNIGVLMPQGQADQVEGCDAHFRTQRNACQPPMLEFVYAPRTTSCISNLQQSKWLSGL